MIIGGAATWISASVSLFWLAESQVGQESGIALTISVVTAIGTLLAAVAGGAIASRGGMRVERQRQARDDRIEWGKKLGRLEKDLDVFTRELSGHAYSSVYELLVDMNYATTDSHVRALIADLQVAVNGYQAAASMDGYYKLYDSLDRLATSPPPSR